MKESVLMSDRFGISSSALKWVAIITMLIDHIGFILLYPLVLTGGVGLSPAMKLVAGLYGPCRLVGRVAFPVFCYLIVEGVVHSRNPWKYALRIGGFALLSEVPYDLANFGVWLEFSRQNVMFTLLLGLLTLMGLEYINKRWPAGAPLRLILWALTVAAGCAAVLLIRGEYSVQGILVIALFYLCRAHRGIQIAAGLCPLFFVTPGVLLAALPLGYYNGQRGQSGGRYFFYAFYPLHLLALVAISRFI